MTVRVRPCRAVTIRREDSDSVLYVAGEELELEPAEEKALTAQGFVDRIKSERHRASASSDEDELS